MEQNNFLAWLAGVLSLLNGAFLLYSGWKKFKPEIKKMDADAKKTDVEVDLDVLEGAKMSQQLLIDRINDLQTQLNAEREQRKLELTQEREQRKAELAAEREARRKSEDYLRKRLKDSERESRDYRSWAAKLAKQVIDAGKIPAPFIPSPEDSEVGISAIRDDEDGAK